MRDQAPRSRPPGWYRDPEDPGRLRYWGGKTWTSRRRSRPAWESTSTEWIPPAPEPSADDGDDGPVLEGPVHSAELPAIAAAVIGLRDSTPALDRVAGTGRRGSRAPAMAARPPGRRAGQPTGPRPWLTSRRPMALFGLAAAIAMLAMVVGFGVARPPGYSQWLLSDQSFLSRANTMCRTSLPALRAPGQEAMTTSGPAPPTPTALDVQAAGVDALANQLASLPISTSDKSHVDGWLTGWHNWASDQRAYARYIATHPGSAVASTASAAARANASGKANQLQAMSQVEAAAADHFAIANGLVYCTLSPASSTSQPPAETSTGSQRNSPTSAVTAPARP